MRVPAAAYKKMDLSLGVVQELPLDSSVFGDDIGKRGQRLDAGVPILFLHCVGQGLIFEVLVLR
jgi:hypothetical protein